MIACLWGVPVAFALLFGSRRCAKKYSTLAKQAALTASDAMQEAIETVREIQATNQEERCLSEVYEKIDAHEKSLIYGELSAGIFVNAASVIMRLGVATTILTGAGLILSGSISFMTLFLFLLVITRVYAPFDQSLALIAEVFIVRSVCPTSYRNPRNQNRLYDIQGGTITVGGVNIQNVEPETLLTDYSMVFQDVVLFDDTVMENIRLGKHGATDEEVIDAAKAANCDEFVSKLPDGYQTRIGENGAKLSGGERQRISIARALLKNAPIVLLDEATASLDVENETKVQTALSRLLKGKTVLVIAHRMRTVEAADKIVVLKDGKVAEEGAPKTLLSNKDSLFSRMHALQSEEF